MSKEKKQAPPKKTRKQKRPNLRHKAFKFRIYPTEKQIGTLEWVLRRCKELYNCECVVKKDLSVRWHSCPHCGCELDRDHNASLNILIHYQKSKGAGSVPQLSHVGEL